MEVNLHPIDPTFLESLCQVVPPPLSGFLSGLCAASSTIWDNGGLMVQEVSRDELITWQAGAPSTNASLQEFFACVCGDRDRRGVHQAQTTINTFLAAIGQSFPSCDVHIQTEDLEPSWCQVLHILVSAGGVRLFYLRLFWSVD